MNLTSPKEIKELLSQHFARPSKTMGQNFLIDQSILNKIIKTANLTKEDTVLEIGPGIGTLTKELATVAKKVVAVEKDRVMVQILKETLKDVSNVEVIEEDALAFDEKEHSSLHQPYKVIANIPYYITSPLIRKFLESDNKPTQIVLMIQKEVAKRICSTPPDMSLLAVSVQCYANAKIMFSVSKNSFWPAPKIDSAIINIIPKEQENIDINLFFRIVKAGFSHPRKQLLGNLSQGLQKEKDVINNWLLQNNLSPKQRAETLSIENWIHLTKTLPL